jgi:LasA protease
MAAFPAQGALASPRAESDEMPIGMDGRFSGFDIVRHVRVGHPALASRAEIISHWAGYYSVNPVLLVQVLDARSRQGALTGDSIRQTAHNLAEVAELWGEPPSGDLATSIGRTDMLSPEAASIAVEAARLEINAAGLAEPLTAVSETAPLMDLPYLRPQAWQFNGVHTWTGNEDGTALSSIDFVRSWSTRWGDDTSGDRVSAAFDGLVTVYSSCFVQVQHDSGWATRYYHMDNLQVENGQRVLAGDLLGNYANNKSQALCSGGHSTSPHLHFALLKDGQYAALQNAALSGYLIHSGEYSYDSSPDRMWLEKRAVRFHAFDQTIAQGAGDNIIDYRYNGMWYAPGHDGHGLNVEITEYADGGAARKAVFVAMYTYDDDGVANFYAGNRDYERWRSDEGMVIDMLQTSGGDFSDLSPIDFADPEYVKPAGQLELRFSDCAKAEVSLDLDERSTGQPVRLVIDLVKLIGVPDHVCAAASLPLPD